MRGTVAKAIRRAAVTTEARMNPGKPAPWRAYGVRNQARTRRVIDPETGETAGTFQPTGTMQLQPYCVRALYRRIKRNYKRVQRRSGA